jgi:hypothetical protein
LPIDKIGIAFGWPVWARKLNPCLGQSFPSVPLQILDGCLQGLTFSTLWPSPLLTPSPQATVPSCGGTWLPTIQKFLSHLWVDAALVTGKAAKRDDTCVPTHLWDQRCTLVLPSVAPALKTLRLWLMHRTASRLWSECFSYLSERHGDTWRAVLNARKQALKAQGHSHTQRKGMTSCMANYRKTLQPRQMRLVDSVRPTGGCGTKAPHCLSGGGRQVNQRSQQEMECRYG